MPETLPSQDRLIYATWPEESGIEVQFRLVYQGSLPSASSGNRTREKHAIRKVFHSQLRELWDRHPLLAQWKHNAHYQNRQTQKLETIAEKTANNFLRCGYRFLPLVTAGDFLACSLDILFLRPENPGDIITGGDIDNRIKVLFDALRMPQNCSELNGEKPSRDEDPFYCLLEDDRLIVEVNVTTDRLLQPSNKGKRDEVHLVIHVRTLVTGGEGYLAFMT